MPNKPRFVDALTYQLENFELNNARGLVDKIDVAESEEGYELTVKELKLLDRLLNCIASYQRTLYGL